MDHNDGDLQTLYTDPRGIDTDFVYNGFGDLLSETSADRGTMTYTYNTRGLPSQMTDARGIVSTYTYDNGGRLVAHNYPSSSGEDQTFEYDRTYSSGTDLSGVGKISRIYDESGWTRTRYDKREGTPNYKQQKIEADRYSMRFSYDEEGNLIWVRYPSLRTVKHTYDYENRVQKVQQRMHIKTNGSYPAWEDVVKFVRYEPMGPMRKMRYRDGSTQTRSYDDSYRLTRIKDLLGTTILREVDYGYDTRDDLISVSDQLDAAMDESYSYTNRQLLDIASGNYGTLDFDYDAVGNRIAKTSTVNAVANTDTYTYPLTSNKLSQISRSDGGDTRLYTYDAAGNVTSDTRADGTQTYTYNAAGRMDSFSLNGVLQAEYEYNAMGHQTVRRLTQLGMTVHTVHDVEGNRIAEYNADTDEPLVEYIWMNGEQIGIVVGGVTYYTRSDHIARPVFGTDVSGNVIGAARTKPARTRCHVHRRTWLLYLRIQCLQVSILT